MDVTNLELSELSQRCRNETILYLQGQIHDSRYCFELFRRCFETRDHQVWEQVFTLYEPQVARWVRSNPTFTNSGEEVQYFVNRAIEKMWTSISPEKFSRFLNLQSLLRYLKMCVGSVIIDHYRARERLNLEELNDMQIAITHQQESSVENFVFNKAYAEEIWKLAKNLVNNKQEHDVLYGSFILGLKPRDIHAQFPGKFSDVKEIYRIKENLLSRFRRNKELTKLLGKTAGEVE